jgi:glycerol-3-phosphate acyltransferase PlsY
MILNVFLLLLVAFVAYCVGSISTLRVASQYVFRRNLQKLGKGNVWLSNFRRLYGPIGFVKLGLVEIGKDLLALLFGALLISFRGRADIGVAFGGFCLMMGRLWPVFNRFRGSHGCLALIMTGLLISPPIGVTAILGVVLGIWISKSVTVGAVVGAIAMAAISVMVLDAPQRLILILIVLIAVLVLVHHIPSLRRLFRHEEERLSRVEDITYKFDEKF